MVTALTRGVEPSGAVDDDIEGRASRVTFWKKFISARIDGHGSVPLKPMPREGRREVATMRYKGRSCDMSWDEVSFVEDEVVRSSAAYRGSSVDEAGESVVGGGVAVILT